MPVIPKSWKNILKGCLISECLKWIYAAFDLMPESESNARGNILQDCSEKCHWNATRVIKLSATLKMQTNSDCICNSSFKGKYVFCSWLLRQNQHNSICSLLLLWHFEPVWVQKFSASTCITEIHSHSSLTSLCFLWLSTAHLWLRFTLHFLLSVNATYNHYLGLINIEGAGRTVTNLQEQEAATPGCTCLLSLSRSANTPVHPVEASWILADWHWQT